MRLHQIPLFGYLIEILAFLDHGFKDLFIQKYDLLDFNGEIVFVGERVGEHDARSNAHGRHYKMINDEIGHICLSTDIEQDELLFGDISDDFFSLPRVEFKDELLVLFIRVVDGASFDFILDDLFFTKNR